MEIDNKKISEYLGFVVSRKIVNLYKSFLFILEDIRDKKFDIEDERIFQMTRKRVLDLSNDTLREISENLNKLEINLKNKED